MTDPLHRYYTPPWMTKALFLRLPLPALVASREEARGTKARILEPCAGPSYLARVLRDAGAQVTTGDLDPEVARLVDHTWDFPEWVRLKEQRGEVDPRQWDAVITNPPFHAGPACVEAAMRVSPVVAMLLRLSFLEPCGDRAHLLHGAGLAHVIVLPRDGFIYPGKGKSKGGDTQTCAWFVWRRGYEGTARIEHVTAREMAELRGQLEFDFWCAQVDGQRQRQSSLWGGEV